MIDARNQYNEAYQGFYDQLTDAGRDEKMADREARIIAARATTLAIIRKQSVGDILNRWKLRIEGDQTKINMPGEDAAELDAIDVEPSTQEELNLLQKDIDRLKRGVTAKKKAKGTRLAQFIVQNGGISDDRGDIKAMGSMSGLLNKKGISLDEAARMAWDAGYITGAERPDVNKLLDLLSDDLGNRPVYTENDQLKGDSNDYYRSLEEALDRAGVDIDNDSIEEIDRKLKVYEKKRAAWEQKMRGPEENILPEDDLPFWQEARKLAEDINRIDRERLEFERKDINPELKGRENEVVEAVKINRFFADRENSKSVSLDDVIAAFDTKVKANEKGMRVLKNSARGETATLSNKALHKMFNTTTMPDNENIGGILGKECIANIADIFDSAILVKTHNDEKHESKNKIYRYANVIQSQKDSDSPAETFIVKITVKELANGNKDLTDIEIEENGGRELAAYDLKVGRKNTAGNSLGNFAKADKATVAHNSGNDVIINDLIEFVNTYTDKKININGVDRWAINSDGSRIAKTAEGLRAFYEWFGDSKVVDEQGRPLVVYHGTNAEFSVFDKRRQRKHEGRTGFWFSNVENDFGTSIGGEKIVMPVYLSMSNPFIVDANGKNWSDIAVDRSIYSDIYEAAFGYKFDGDGSVNADMLSAYAKKFGYDGLIINNVVEGDLRGATQRRKLNDYVAFEPNQIKSTSNRGTYSEKENNIYWQSAVVRDLFDTQGDLFEQPQSKQTQTAQQPQQAKQLPAEAQKQVDDLFAYAEKQEGVKKEAPLFSDKKETQKIEKSYTASDNQKIVDVGDKLLGNLKRDTRVLSWEELEKMNDLLRTKNLTKANIYPKPSIEELRAQGLDGRPAAVVMYVYNSINAKPSKSVNPTIENQKRYFNVVKRTMDNTIEYAKTHKDEIENWQRSMSWNEDLLRMVFPSEEKTVGKIFRENREYNTEVTIAGGNKFANGMLISGYDLAELDKIAAGFEQEASAEKQSKASQTKEPWQRYFTVGKTYGGQYIVVDRNGKTISRDLTFDTVEKAVEFATKAYEIIKPHLRGEGETVDFSNMRNKGLQRRENNQNVNAQALIDTFGFRGINFGNWTKQSERQDFLNLTYDSFFDMAEILGIPAKAIGLEGKLGLAFGAQGHAGAAGHFIPAYNEINLTRKYGAGSLAHEWWHALDYYFGDQANQKDYSGVPSLELKEGGSLRSETFEAIKNLYDTISTTELTDEELKERAKKRYDSLKYIVDHRANELKNKFAKEKNAEEIAKFIDELVAQDKNFDASKRKEYTEKFSEMIPERRRTWENASIFTDMTFKLQSIHDLEDSQQSWRKSSEFYENARKLDKLENKSYWTKRTELGARAFASYIDDKIANRDWYNYFLSGHAKLQIFDDKSYLRDWADAREKNTTVDVNDYRIPIYPANTVEQANINAAFDNLFNTIKVDESKDFRLYQSAYAPAHYQVVYHNKQGRRLKR
ncbi:MAG: hypothetical protein Q4D11_05255 [Rhodospirillales bacterium]|nr:hypothetical protein [Rhodospirillales bacterium]